jgi:hypothetical protein
VRLIAFAAILLMGPAGMAAAQRADASGTPAGGAMSIAGAFAGQAGTGANRLLLAQTNTNQTGTSQPGTSDQNGGSGDDTTGSQPVTGGTGDQGSGTNSNSGAGSNPPAPAQENASPAPPSPPPLNPALDAQAKLLLRQLTAKQLDPRLPAQALPDWFAQQIGKRAQIDWTTGDCSDEADYSGSGGDNSAAGGASYDPTLCTEGQALFYGPDGKASLDRYVVLQITVGSRQNGINRDPTSYGPDAVTIFVFDGSATRTLSRLGDLPATLGTMN